MPPALRSPATVMPSCLLGVFSLVASRTPLSSPSPKTHRSLVSALPPLWSASRLFLPPQDRTLLKLWQRWFLPSCPWKPWNFLGHLAASLWDLELASCPSHLALWPWVGHCPSLGQREQNTCSVWLTSVPSHTHVCAGHVSTCQCHLWCWGRVGALGPVAPLPWVSSSSSASLQVISHDTRRFRFALPSPEHILGLPVGECSPDPAHTEPALGKGGGGRGVYISVRAGRASRRRCQPSQAFEDECHSERAECSSVPGSGPSTSKGRELGCDGSPWGGGR